MRRDLPSRFEPKITSQSTAVTIHELTVGGLFVLDTSGITVTLPSPQQAADGVESIFVNNSNNDVTLACTNGFPNSADTITLGAGASAFLYCARVSQGSYIWASVGATAS